MEYGGSTDLVASTWKLVNSGINRCAVVGYRQFVVDVNQMEIYQLK